jgi:Zn-dependent protease with chaperone function
MDFFAAQEKARATSRRLVFWFALSVCGVVGVLYALVVFAKPLIGDPTRTGIQWWDAEVAWMVMPTVGGIILLGSLYKLMQLSAGGAVVARDMGGRAVDPSTTDPLERRLLNVVEEMSIASGLAAPEVWVMDQEEGINAFAAGTDPANAVIGVTRGCLEKLNRAELQGVVAHEFSHILNGDMKLNMRLIGWIFGLVMIAMFGRMLLQLVRHLRPSRDSDGKVAGGVLLLALAGLALWGVGSIGVLFAKLLQAGVSRQREYLADAAAVQFTRNPSGLADALKKVGGFWRNGMIQTPHAAEARHLFFASSELVRMGFATHPPLEARIRAIEPSWEGGLIEPEDQVIFEDEGAYEGAAPSMLAPATAAFALDTLGDSSRLDPQVGVELKRRLAKGRVVFSSKLEAKALLYGLLLAQDGDARVEVLDLLRGEVGGEVAAHADLWHRELLGRSAAEKLALVDLSLPWLRRMARDEAQGFIDLTRRLIDADGQVQLFEFMLQKVIERQVAVGLGLRGVAKIRHRALGDLARETAVLAGAFGALSADPAAWEVARVDFRGHTGLELQRLGGESCGMADVAAALHEFEAATPLVKVQVLRLCGLVAVHDGVLGDGEVELLRACAEAIGAPLPPLTRMAVVA